MDKIWDFEVEENEKPFDRELRNGGYFTIFRKVACVGDSLSSGEIEIVRPTGTVYVDQFEQSWGQYLGRLCGQQVYNFSRGGMTASEYCDSFAEANDFWNKDKAAQAYIIALGVNDLLGMRQEVGSCADIDINDYNNNKKTFAGYYGKIIQKYKEIEPNAKFFLVSMCKDSMQSEENIAYIEAHLKVLNEMAGFFTNTYVIDLLNNAPDYGNDFHDRYFLSGHMTSWGYRNTAVMLATYLDFIIRSNPKDFIYSQLIGHPEFPADLCNK